MSSDATPETERPPKVGIERPRFDGTVLVRRNDGLARLERRLLCRRIAQLEQELSRERARREQIVEQYERLLSESRTEPNAEAGLLDRLF